MAKNRVTKRLLSIVLSLLIVVTSIPFSAVTALANNAQDRWEVLGSTDFTKASWSSGNNTMETTSYPTLASAGGSALSWGAYESGDTSVTTDSSGSLIDSGMLYLKSYNSQTSTTPFAGLKNFKVEVNFQFTSNISISARDSYTFFKLSTNTGSKFGKPSENAWDNTFFAQDGFGTTHSSGSPANYNAIFENGNYVLGTNNSILSKNATYTYVYEYLDGYNSSYVVDSNGTVVIHWETSSNSVSVDRITALTLGSCNTTYYPGIKYQSVIISKQAASWNPVSPVDAAKDKYLFCYFTGTSNEGQTLHLAVSADGLNYTALNNNNAVIRAAKGTGSVRDPYLFYNEVDKYYYILATDLDFNDAGGTGYSENSTAFMVWRSKDLVNWTDETLIDLSKCSNIVSSPGNMKQVWAPQAMYVDGEYYIYFTLNCDQTGGNMALVYTTASDIMDSSTYTQVQTLFDPNYHVIDADIILNPNDGEYYLFYKNEDNGYNQVYGSSTSGATRNTRSDLKTPHAFKLVNGLKHNYSGEIDADGGRGYRVFSNNTLNLEGVNSFFKADGTLITYADNYDNSGTFYVTKSYDCNTFIPIDDTGNLNTLSPRHGSVINITTEKYNELLTRSRVINSTTFAEGETKNNHLKARYFTTLSDVTKNDVTGNSELSITGEVTMKENVDGQIASAYFKGGKKGSSQASVSVGTILGSNSFNYNDGFTLTFKAKLDSDAANHANVFAIGNSFGNKNSGTYLLHFTPNGDDSGGLLEPVSDTKWHWINKNNFSGSAFDYSGDTSWHQYFISSANGNLLMFVDGELKVKVDRFNTRKDGAEVLTDTWYSTLSSPSSTLALGWSGWPADNDFKGYISDFCVYDTAMSYYDLYTIQEENENKDAKDYLATAKSGLDVATVNAKSPERFNEKGYFATSEATGAYSNMLYCSTVLSESDQIEPTYGIFSTSGGIYYKMVFPKVAVMAYDGSDTFSPASVIAKLTSRTKREIRHVSVDDSQVAELREVWHGYKSYGDNSKTWPGNATDGTFEYRESTSHTSGQQVNRDTWRAWGNKLYYSGTGNTTDYVDIVENQRYHCHSNRDDDCFKSVNASFKNYYLNYKPVKEIINGTANVTKWGTTYNFKSLFKKVYNDDDILYTPASLGAYYNAVRGILNLNVNDLCKGINDNNAQSKVENAAAQIKKAVEDYNTAVANLTKQYHITFTDNFGNKVYDKYIKDGGIIPEQANTATAYDAINKKHTVYSWTPTFNATATQNVDYTETSSTSNCNFTVTRVEATCRGTGLETGVCEVCQGTYRITLSALGHSYDYTSNKNGTHTATCNRDGCTDSTAGHTKIAPCSFTEEAVENGTKYTCTECRYSFTRENLQTDEYYAAVEVAKAALDMTDKYESEGENGLNALNALINAKAIEFANPDLTQEQLTAITKEIVEATNLLTIKSYNVTFVLYDEQTDSETKVSLEKEKYKYGEVFTATVPYGYDLPHKWTKSVNNGEVTLVANATNEVSFVIAGDTNIVACYGAKDAAAEQHKITVFNQFGRVVDYMYVNDGAFLTYEGSSLAAGGNVFTFPKVPFYQIKAYLVNGVEVKSGYAVTQDIEVYPSYEIDGTITITLDSASNIAFKDGTTEPKTVTWDEKVVVNSNDGVVVWLFNGVRVAEGESYTFRATVNATISTEKVTATTGNSTITYYGYDNTTYKARVVVSSMKLADKEITEQGLYVLPSKTESTFTQEDVLTKGMSRKATNTTDTKDQFQFTLNLGQNTTIKTIGLVGYVTYSDGTTVYSEVKNLSIV